VTRIPCLAMASLLALVSLTSHAQSTRKTDDAIGAAFSGLEQHYKDVDKTKRDAAEQRRREAESDATRTKLTEAATAYCKQATRSATACQEDACGKPPLPEICVDSYEYDDCGKGGDKGEPGKVYICFGKETICRKKAPNPDHAKWQQCTASHARSCAPSTKFTSTEDCVTRTIAAGKVPGDTQRQTVSGETGKRSGVSSAGKQLAPKTEARTSLSTAIKTATAGSAKPGPPVPSQRLTVSPNLSPATLAVLRDAVGPPKEVIEANPYDKYPTGENWDAPLAGRLASLGWMPVRDDACRKARSRQAATIAQDDARGYVSSYDKIDCICQTTPRVGGVKQTYRGWLCVVYHKVKDTGKPRGNATK